VARKGAHAVRAAALALDLEVMLMGGDLEGPDFWRGVRTVPAGDWKTAAAVVQPALVENQPRGLLAALAARVPVIATAACGLEPQPGLTLISPDDGEALIASLKSFTKQWRGAAFVDQPLSFPGGLDIERNRAPPRGVKP
jgi:hypothetical protein